MWKKVALCLLAFALITVSAMAAPGDTVLFSRGEDGEGTVYVESAAVVDGALYIKSDTVIYRWAPGDAEPTVFFDMSSTGAAADESGAVQQYDGWAYGALMDWQGKPTMLQRRTGELCEVTATGLVTLEGKVDAASLSGASSDPEQNMYLIQSLIPVGADLFAIARPSEMEWNNRLYSVNTQTGALTELTTEKGMRVMGASVYRDGKLILVVDRSESVREANDDNRYPKMQIWDIAGAKFDGDPISMGETWNIQSVYYDAATDYVYYASGTRLMRARPSDSAPPETVNYLSSDGSYNEAPGMMIDGKFVVASYQGIYISSVDPEQLPKRVLRVAGDWGDTLAKFLAMYPDIAVDRVDMSIYDTESLTAAVAGGQMPDIYTYNTYSDHGILFSKGYAADLSADPELLEIAKQLYPAIQDIIFYDGKLMAYPQWVNSGLWSYDQKVFEDLDIEYPETIADLLQLMDDWEDDYQDEVDGRPLMQDYMQEKSQMFNYILDAYLAQFSDPDQPIKFDTPEFREVMGALERSSLKQITDEEREAEAVGRAVMYQDDEYKEPVIDQNANFWTYYGNSTKRFALPPKLTSGSEARSTGYLSMFVVNPDSQNMDIALDYIKFMATNSSDVEMEYLINPNKNEPRENRHYKESLVEMQKSLEELEAMDVSASQQRDHEQQIKDIKQSIAESDGWRYEVSPEGIADYRELGGYVHYARSNPLFSDNNTVQELYAIIERYRQGQLNLDQMIRELDQKSQMIFLETR